MNSGQDAASGGVWPQQIILQSKKYYGARNYKKVNKTIVQSK